MIVLGELRNLFSGPYRQTRVGLSNYDISPDGTYFVMIETNPDAEPTRANVILNWFEDLKQRVPTGGR